MTDINNEFVQVDNFTVTVFLVKGRGVLFFEVYSSTTRSSTLEIDVNRLETRFGILTCISPMVYGIDEDRMFDVPKDSSTPITYSN